MNKDESKLIFEKVAYAFGSNVEPAQALQWKNYLSDQDFGVSRQVADWFVKHSGKQFMPSIAEFHEKVKTQQAEVSRRELVKRDMAACTQCNGLTWEEDPTGYIPCSQCRPEALRRWEESIYAPGVPPNPEELDGPKENHPPAAEPRPMIGPPVSSERASQWRQHLLSGSSSVYPEGDTILESELHNGL